MGDASQSDKQLNNLFQGDLTGVVVFNSEEEFNKAKVIQAKKMGMEFLKSKLSEEAKFDCITDADFEKAFEQSGNGIEVFSKVYTLIDGRIACKV